jgi:DNA-binding MarR family transcriptional regulator
MIEKTSINFEKTQELLFKRLQEMAPGESIYGLELVNLMRMSMHFIEGIIGQHPRLGELSGPRMGILMRLMAEEDMGNSQGVNPTRLSHYQNVKKNTVSSLISGLEEQGLVERTINSDDKRGFNIRLTNAGRELITSSMPERIRFLNEITSGLTEGEKREMINLLMKLRVSLIKLRHNSQDCAEPTKN